MVRWSELAPLCMGVLLLASCADLPEDDAEIVAEAEEAVVTVPAKGTAGTLDIGCWNIEWFGSSANGPSNETLQLQNARDVINGTDLDLWGVVEIVSATQFNDLKSQLPGYAGFLSNDATVTSGSSYYTSGEQKVGLLYKSSIVSVQSAKLILTANDYDFGGRPPLEVKLTATVNGMSADLVVIVLHAKALGDTESYNRRVSGSIALKSYLDATYPTQKVIVLGDYNDDIDVSMVKPKVSPYKNFVDDSADYFFANMALSLAGESSYIGDTDMIDHHLLTNEMATLYVPGSAEIDYLSAYVPSYSSTTSDHYPVLSRYSLGSASPAQVFINEILANEAGSNTAGEFVEIVNTGGTAADLSGWTLADATQVRHTFAAGTSLAPHSSIVVFGAAAGIPAGMTNAVAASTATLSLNNSTDSVILQNGATTVDSVNYSSSLASTDGVSMNRSPDATVSGTFVLHTTLAATQSSPGTKVTGAGF